ncbi:MAG: hypothetical protein ABDH20_01505 [Thermus sp.]
MKEEIAKRLEEVLTAMQERGRNLIAATAAHAEARLAYEAALDTLEDARARAIREGLEGKNEQARQAELLERTRAQEEAFRSARAVLRVAEANLEMARVAWQTEREALKALASLLRGGTE